jgi:DNA-binding FadR family transcriptional regulator
MVLQEAMVIPSPGPDDTKQFTAIRQSRVSGQISDQIKRMIIQGDLKPGDKLPSERDLARELGVGRLSVREGLRILEASGIIETRYGVSSGTYVSEIGLETISGKLSEVMCLSEHITMETLYEARLEIGLVSLKFFVRRGDAEDIQRLEACLAEQERLLSRGMRTREQNIQFHRLIAQGSKNPVFMLVQNSVLDSILQFLSNFENPGSHSKKILAANRRILTCLKEKDLAGASKALRSYVSYTKEHLRSRLERSSDPSAQGGRMSRNAAYRSTKGRD